VRHLQEKRRLSQRRACRLLGQHRGSQRYEPKPPTDEGPIVKRMLELVRRRPRFGYRRIWALLRQEGFRVNRKRIYRLWRREGLKRPMKPKRKRACGGSENACHRRKAERPNDVWAWDFVFDRTASGSTLKWLSIVDEWTRECLVLKVARGLTAEDLIDTLAELFAMRGVPRVIRSDNGPEFAAKALKRWLEKLDVGALYVAPGSPWENGYAESFHSKLRDEFLTTEVFDGLRDARALTKAWQEDYNEVRPHSSLGYVAPTAFARSQFASARATPSLPRTEIPTPTRLS
jgi:putative transposase